MLRLIQGSQDCLFSLPALKYVASGPAAHPVRGAELSPTVRRSERTQKQVRLRLFMLRHRIHSKTQRSSCELSKSWVGSTLDPQNHRDFLHTGISAPKDTWKKLLNLLKCKSVQHQRWQQIRTAALKSLLGDLMALCKTAACARPSDRVQGSHSGACRSARSYPLCLPYLEMVGWACSAWLTQKQHWAKPLKELG